MDEAKGLNPYFEGNFDEETADLRELRLALVRERDELRAELAAAKGNYGRACKLVADMHGAATGNPVDGLRRGVVEDVADLRAALVLVMNYPDVRQYLGGQVAGVADAALGAA
jgi:hypothetical protein